MLAGVTASPRIAVFAEPLALATLLALPLVQSILSGDLTQPNRRIWPAAFLGIAAAIGAVAAVTPWVIGPQLVQVPTLGGAAVWASPGPARPAVMLFALAGSGAMAARSRPGTHRAQLSDGSTRWLLPIVLLAVATVLALELSVSSGGVWSPLVGPVLLLGVLLLADTHARHMVRLERELAERVAHRTARLEADRTALSCALDSVNHDVARTYAGLRDLLVAERMASLGMVAGGVAHEVNNPLTLISANLGFVQDRMEEIGLPADPELGAALKDARSGVERIASTIRGYRRFAEPIGEGQYAVDVHDVVKLAARLVEAELSNRADVILELGVVPLVSANDATLVHVLVNVMMLASQSRSARLVEIVLRAEPLDGGVGLTIEHSGTELEAESLDGPVSGDHARDDDGLRLSISHSLLTKSGATLEVDRASGRSKFVLWLPPAGANTPLRDQARLAAPRPADIPPLRVLLLGEDPRVSGALGRALRGHAVVEVARTVDVALTRWRNEGFDILLAELSLAGPGLTGIIERAFPGERRVLYLAGSVFTVADKNFVEANPEQVLRWPATRAELLARLEMVVSRPRNVVSTRVLSQR